MRFKTILLAVLTAAMMMMTPVSANNDSDTVYVAYPLDFTDVKRVHFMLNTLNNLVKHYQKSMIDYEISVVAYGPGLQYVMKDFKGTGFAQMPYLANGGPAGNGTQGRMAALMQLAGDSLRLYVCENTMEKKNVKKEQLQPYTEVTPGGVLKLIELQREGAALIKIQ